MRIHKISPIIGCFASSFLLASHSFADGYFGSISAEVNHSDNGNKSTNSPISEVQQQYNLNLGASYENTIGKFEADYGASYRGFSEETQPNKSTLAGHSALQLGHESDIAELLVEHSRQTLLNKADSLDLTGNQDEREVIAVSPTLNWHFSSADILFLKGNYSDISYMENELNNSTRAGAILGALHRITEVDSFGLSLQSTKVKFEYFPASDYELRSALLSYSARLRQLSYSVQAGASQTETDDGEKYTTPSYLLALSYKSGVNTFQLNLAREITDTSFGGGNKDTTEGPPSSDGSTNQSSQIDRKRADIQWITTAVCDRCTLTLSVHQTRDEYLTINNKVNEVGATIAGDYVVSPAATLSLRLTQAEHRFPDTTTLGENYKLTIASLSYSHRIGKSFYVKGSLSNEKRVDDNSATGYDEKLIGLSLGYSF